MKYRDYFRGPGGAFVLDLPHFICDFYNEKRSKGEREDIVIVRQELTQGLYKRLLVLWS